MPKPPSPSTSVRAKRPHETGAGTDWECWWAGAWLGRRVLRARTMAGIAQEVYALLTAYQLIRIAIADASTSVPGADPDRASFSIALQTARDQIVQAAGVLADTAIDLIGAIGRAVPGQPMPDRRLRCASAPAP